VGSVERLVLDGAEIVEGEGKFGGKFGHRVGQEIRREQHI